MQIIDNQALQLTLPSTMARNVLSSVPFSEELKTVNYVTDMLLYWGYDEASYLASVIDTEQPNDTLPNVPSPILRDYNWPGFFTPFDHQKTTASYLSLRKRAFCFNEQGTGKTSAAIWAADYLMSLGKIKKVLIVCPLSIMYTAWHAEIFKIAMHRTAAVAHGDRKRRVAALKSNTDFTIINFDGMSVVREEIINSSFDLIIIDEANSYKNVSTKRWKTLAKIITPTTWVWMMTGTPASQSPEDAFGLAKVVAPWRVPKFKTAWRDKVMMPVSRFKWVPKPTARRDVHYALQPAIRFTKDECLDLPDVVYLTREVPLTVQVMTYYKRLKSQMLVQAAGQQISAVNAAASLSKLLQISGGAVYTDDRDIIEFDVSPRLQTLLEVLDETDHKVIVFVPYLHTIDVVSSFLTNNGITNEVIKGSVSARERADIIKRFQQLPDPRVLVIQPQSASHGVTLTEADTVVFWSPVMSVETYLQCIARIDRVGQKNKMTVVHLQGSEVERKVYAMLEGRVDSHQKLVDLYNNVMETG